MSRISPPLSFPFEAFALQRSRDREAEKRSLWKGVLALLKGADLIERAQFCPITLTGLIVLFARRLDEPGWLAEAYAVGLTETTGYAEPEPEVEVEPLQVISGPEPGRPLLERLAAEDFRRMTAPGVEPVIYMGRGSLAAWKVVQNADLRVTRCDLPGGTIHGLGVFAGAAAPVGETAGGEAVTSAAGSVAVPGSGGGALPAVPPVPVGSETCADENGDARLTRPYRWALLSAPADREGWALHLATDAERDAMMRAVVAQQGPLNLDTAIEAVRRGLGTAAIRSNGRQKLDEALKRMQAAGAVIETDGGFYRLPGQPVPVRDRTGCGERLRRLAALPPVEIDAAIREALAEGGPAEETAMVVGAALRLGYLLKSPETYPALAVLITRRIESLVNDCVAIRSADGLVLATVTDPAENGDWMEDRIQAGSEDRHAEAWPNADGRDHVRREVGRSAARGTDADEPPALEAAE